MNHFIALQHTYDGIELALFNGQTVVQKIVDDKKKASKNIVVLVKNLLQDNNVFFDDLLFFAVNQGPGPFTTLRVVIASANGFAFATKKPMIGIDGLEALLEENRKTNSPVTVALLNAYSGDVYFGIQTKEKTAARTGYQNAATFFAQLKKQFSEPIRFIGQAVDLYKQEIKETFGTQADIHKPTPANCSIEQIGSLAWQRWQKKQKLTEQLLPRYLKSMKLQGAVRYGFDRLTTNGI